MKRHWRILGPFLFSVALRVSWAWAAPVPPEYAPVAAVVVRGEACAEPLVASQYPVMVIRNHPDFRVAEAEDLLAWAHNFYGNIDEADLAPDGPLKDGAIERAFLRIDTNIVYRRGTREKYVEISGLSGLLHFYLYDRRIRGVHAVQECRWIGRQIYVKGSFQGSYFDALKNTFVPVTITFEDLWTLDGETGYAIARRSFLNVAGL